MEFGQAPGQDATGCVGAHGGATTGRGQAVRRDNRIRNVGLESARFPTATFHSTGPVTVPATATTGSAVSVTVGGDLTIHGVIRHVSLPVQAQVGGGLLQVAGSITVPAQEYGMQPPSIGGFVSVEDSATMEFRLDLGR